ncbi:hypothetical protein CROQUDRAFT_673980 [Cronartium quercuum f. sp. fusiforme G11]|uniref:alpha-1,2-Mannosidase n=1 Tax=Cronartium quercuum f. sp. fusiforme G11 TaxID=708437 RepID=A0A9P6N9B3_9BASI|nr:hypothetical protein CROQUDRAFT_673980 [Cronartium quercuum f. sp. fusiforme G11]
MSIRKRNKSLSPQSQTRSSSQPKSSSKSQPEPDQTSCRRLVTLLIIVLLATILTVAYYPRRKTLHTQTSTSFKRYSLPTGPWEGEPRKAVIKAIKESWNAYAESEAWGSDEFYVLTGMGGNLSNSGSIGFFIVDVLDTLLLTQEMPSAVSRARTYVTNELNFDIDGDLNAFETTIRVLGGLLAAYHLSGNDSVFLKKAHDLGVRLLPIFDSPTGIPYSFINLKTGKPKADESNSGYSSLAEATTLQLEFKYLAELTQDRRFWDVAERAMMAIKGLKSHNGLLPILISPVTGSTFFSIRLGSRGDSYYEYLIKQYLQTNKTEEVYREMYDIAMTGVKEELVRETEGGLVYIGELHPTGPGTYKFDGKQDHLVCFLGGSLLLGVTEGGQEKLRKGQNAEEDWTIGKELIRTCVETYAQSATGLGAEIVEFKAGGRREWVIPHYNPENPPLDARNILRPETVESLFLGWRATHDPIYREWGWQIFQAFNEHCHLRTGHGGYFSIADVDSLIVRPVNKMETFWLAETLKYLLLLFSEDDSMPLDRYVFNTEAHPLPVFTPTVVEV